MINVITIRAGFYLNNWMATHQDRARAHLVLSAQSFQKSNQQKTLAAHMLSAMLHPKVV
jgi:hypothetical protein